MGQRFEKLIWYYEAHHYSPGSLDGGNQSTAHWFGGCVGGQYLGVDDKHPLLVKPNRERQMKVERLLTTAMEKEAATIGRKFKRQLETTVDQGLKKFNGGPTAPLSERRSRMQERMRTIIERTIPEIQTSSSADRATKSPKTTDAVQNDPLDLSEVTNRHQ